MSGSEPADAVGYLIAGYEYVADDFPATKLAADWDGEVHMTLAAAEGALADCRAAGYPWGIYELRTIVAADPDPTADVNDMVGEVAP